MESILECLLSKDLSLKMIGFDLLRNADINTFDDVIKEYNKMVKRGDVVFDYINNIVLSYLEKSQPNIVSEKDFQQFLKKHNIISK